jgi:hypothetical protein
MLKIHLILVGVGCLLSKVSSCQNNLTYSKVDSIVTSINNSKTLRSVIDTGFIEQGDVKGKYRDCYMVDTLTGELKAFIGSVTLAKTYKSTVVAYYFYNSQLIKVELGDVMGGYKKYNTTYLYYIKEANEQNDTLESRELKKLKYLKLSKQYLDSFKKRMNRE